VALYGPERVRPRDRRQSMPRWPTRGTTARRPLPPNPPRKPSAINILDERCPVRHARLRHQLPGRTAGQQAHAAAELEASYADMLDNVAVKVNRIFAAIIDDLFSDDDLLPRLRRLFWLEATKRSATSTTSL
jgi:hypothetical protein